MRPGPKLKIGPEEEKQILKLLEAGCSLKDAADVLEIGRNTLSVYKRECIEFGKGVDGAIAKGKARLIAKVGKAKPWQAAAWMLERKWGNEFGRKDLVRQEHTGKNGGPIQITDADLSRLNDDDLRAYRDLLAKASGGTGSN